MIAPEKLADLILIDADPLKNMRDLDKITTVSKGGSLHDPPPLKRPAASGEKSHQ